MAERFRVAVLTSTTAPGAGALMEDPNRGTLYDFAGVVTRTDAPRNLLEREAFDAETAAMLRDTGADYVVLAGYHYIVTRPLLAAFPDRILALRGGVRDAIFAGATETRATLSFVRERLGEGAVMLVGPPFPVSPLAADAIARGDYDLAAGYARVHRDWMTRASYGPMLVRAMQFLAAGTLTIVDGITWIDGAPGPCRLGDAPHICHELGDAVQRGIPSSCPFIHS